MVLGTARWSRGSLAAGAEAGAARLAAAGVREGTAVATLLRPGVEGVVGLSAALAAEGVVAPLSPALTPDEVARALGLLRPAALIVEAATMPVARVALGTLAAEARPALVAAGRSAPSDLGIVHPAASARPGELPGAGKLVVWTSGTTGSPRAVLLRGEGIREAAASQLRHMGMAAGDHLPLTLPLSSVGGFMIVLRAALARGVVVPLARFDPAAVVALLAEKRAQHLSLVPVMLRRLVEALEQGGGPSAHGLGTVLVGGAPCPGTLLARAAAVGLPVSPTWGMTESCAQAATASPGPAGADPQTVGPALPHLAVRVTPEGRLALHLPALAPTELSRDAQGRLQLRGLLDPDGWFVTGDLGEVGPGGDVRVTGRATDRIITGGVNVDPVEVERYLESHPEVAEALVVGAPDPEWGERVGALVVLRVGARGGGRSGGTEAGEDAPAGELPPELKARLEAHARAGLAAPKRPRLWLAVRALPRSSAGKADRAEARRRLTRGDPGS